MDDSVIKCDQLMELYEKETKAVSTNFNEKKQLVKRKDSIFYLNFY